MTIYLKMPFLYLGYIFHDNQITPPLSIPYVPTEIFQYHLYLIKHPNFIVKL